MYQEHSLCLSESSFIVFFFIHKIRPAQTTVLSDRDPEIGFMTPRRKSQLIYIDINPYINSAYLWIKYFVS